MSSDTPCIKCHYGEQHPFHDSGEPNWSDIWMWEGHPAEKKVRRED